MTPTWTMHPKVATTTRFGRLEWGHIGATIGGEAMGTEGNRRGAKPQFTGRFVFIVSGSGRASIGLENRKSRKGLPGSNPGPPAIYLRFRRGRRLWWGRIEATLGGFGWLRSAFRGVWNGRSHART